MRSPAVCSVTILAIAGLAWGQAAPKAPARPIVTIAKATPDLAKGPVDPYDAAAERAKFFKAAGKDSELDKKEYDADRAKKTGFIRSFDRWEIMVRFDKDNNTSLDWFEADAYRKKVRELILKSFDADKNARLKGDERTKANAALSSGRIPGMEVSRQGPSGRSGRGPSGRPSGPPSDGPPRSGRPSDGPASGGPPSGGARPEVRRGPTPGPQPVRPEPRAGDDRRERPGGDDRRGRGPDPEAMKKYDKNQDGELSSEERTEMFRDMRNQWMVRRYDKSGDGKLDEQETAVMEKETAERERRMQGFREDMEKRRRAWQDRFDEDKNGKLSEAETAVMRKAEEEARAERQKRFEDIRKSADADGNGETSRDEWRKYWEETRKKFDADGDGNLNEQERNALRKEMLGDNPAPLFGGGRGGPGRGGPRGGGRGGPGGGRPAPAPARGREAS
jgi:Ca2+-binding EF-hand superfamily protein